MWKMCTGIDTILVVAHQGLLLRTLGTNWIKGKRDLLHYLFISPVKFTEGIRTQKQLLKLLNGTALLHLIQ